MTLMGMGNSLRELKEYPEAETALKRALEIQVKVFGEGNPVPQRTIKALVTLYTDWKKPAEAAAYAARVKPSEAKAPAAAAR